MQPIRGWTQRGTAVTTGKARAIRAWTDNSNNRRTAIGTSSRLYIYTEDGTQYDVTPTGFTTGFDDATAATGYGNLYLWFCELRNTKTRWRNFNSQLQLGL